MNMKNIKTLYYSLLFQIILVSLLVVSCERELSDEVEFAKFPNTSEVFTDDPVGLGSNFYFPYGGSKPTAWSVDNEVSYEGSASMRFDVPNANDPEGNFAGAIFRIDGEGSGRDLSGFNVLTFWAKATQAVTISEFGFGEDFGENRYVTSISNVDLTTNWVKYYIPIPDPTNLVQERGLFRYSAGASGNQGGESGYTFWIDELRFENIGTIGQAQPIILNGEDVVVPSFVGTTISLPERGLKETFNLPNGRNQIVIPAPSYFQFNSSDPSVAVVDELGIITVLDSGTSTITASIAGVQALGSITIESLGNFTEAPMPTRDAANVISIFSDAYTNVPTDFFNGFFEPFQTTLGGAPPLNLAGGQVINYTQLNFVGIGTYLNAPSLNLEQMTHLHVDINVQEPIESGDFIRLQLINNVGGNEISGSVTIDGSQLSTNNWVSFDVPLSNFSGLSARNNIGLLFFISDATISDIFVDNIYYFKE